MYKKLRYFYFVLPLLPLVTFAFSLKDSTFGGIITEAISIINLFVPILVSIAFILFFWGLSKFILHSDNQAEVEKGKNYMFWGIIALFILITFRTIVSLVATDLDVGDGTTLPYIPNGQYGDTSGKLVIPGGN